ncbi:uncharacterized protein BDR25DRAFT_361972 [Lindgomyces ingoldianus]|uniref:Uncharacterized protein n=1 Tax=Lindgomyces ingoldianus TaxID=673940 RepID=A0ACB6QD30_9PLEO|nr:uncharacterized protein BDR25DRAFT_361972 [Lindgomyces ingoldianus]KAF2464045.1 hypothetical protein BDR25DRAFT_361972 [Lindgomyces ingoldianus]
MYPLYASRYQILTILHLYNPRRIASYRDLDQRENGEGNRVRSSLGPCLTFHNVQNTWAYVADESECTEVLLSMEVIKHAVRFRVVIDYPILSGIEKVLSSRLEHTRSWLSRRRPFPLLLFIVHARYLVMTDCCKIGTSLEIRKGGHHSGDSRAQFTWRELMNCCGRLLKKFQSKCGEFSGLLAAKEFHGAVKNLACNGENLIESYIYFIIFKSSIIKQVALAHLGERQTEAIRLTAANFGSTERNLEVLCSIHRSDTTISFLDDSCLFWARKEAF